MLKPKKSVEKMCGYTVPMYENHWDIKIDSNENNYGSSPKVIEAIKSSSTDEVSYYPYYGELTQKIADYRGCSIDNIKVTNGADEAISGIIQTYLEQGEKLLTLDISFDMPVIYTQIQGGEIIKVPYEKKWEFPINNFLKAMEDEKVKVIYISSPNNPTGSVIKEDDLGKILEKSEGKAVIIDETYANYSDNTYQKYVKEYDNLFIVRSFSKDFALAGLRLGFIISNSENIKQLKKVISPYSVNALALKAGIAALSDREYFEKIKKEVNETKEEMRDFFENLGARVYSSSANFLLVDFGSKAEFVYNKLKQENISVKLYKKESLLKGHLRVTIPTKEGFIKIQNALKIKPFLVFDMDGVLVNSSSYRETIARVYEKYSKKTITQEKIQEAKNQGGLNNDWDLTEYLLKKEGIKVPYEDIVKTFQKIYWDNGKGLINTETPLFEDSILKELSRKYNIAIYTGRPKEEAIFALNNFNVEELFYPIITADDVQNGKPNPEGLNKIKKMTISNEYYYLGDTVDDIKCAKSAGYIAIGILPPLDKTGALKETLLKEGAKSVLNSVNEIVSEITK